MVTLIAYQVRRVGLVFDEFRILDIFVFKF